MTKIAILGAGGWGTALAIVLSRSRKRHEISLWVHDAGLAESIRSGRENKRIFRIEAAGERSSSS